MKLQADLEWFLKDVGRLEAGGPKLGAIAQRAVTTANVARLVKRLEQHAKINGLMCLTIGLLHIGLIILAAFLVFYYRDDPHAMKLAMGGSGLSLVATLQGLRSFWREKCAFDLLLAVVPNLPAEEVAALAESIYFDDKFRRVFTRKHKPPTT